MRNTRAYLDRARVNLENLRETYDEDDPQLLIIDRILDLMKRLEEIDSTYTETPHTSETDELDNHELLQPIVSIQPSAPIAINGEAEKEERSKRYDPSTFRLTIDLLVSLYNVSRPDELPVVSKITESRRKKYAQYLKQFPFQDYWESVFHELLYAPVLLCHRPSPGHEGFKASLDWLCQKGKDGVENCQKVFEGKYREQAQRYEQSERWG